MPGAEDTSEERKKVIPQKWRKLRAGAGNPGSEGGKEITEERRKGERGRIKKSYGADLWAHYSHLPENGTHTSLPISPAPGQGGEGGPFPRADKNTQSTSAAPISSGTVSGVFWFPVVSVAFLHIVRYMCVLVHRGGEAMWAILTPWFCL